MFYSAIPPVLIAAGDRARLRERASHVLSYAALLHPLHNLNPWEHGLPRFVLLLDRSAGGSTHQIHNERRKPRCRNPMREGLVVAVFVKLKLHGVDHGRFVRRHTKQSYKNCLASPPDLTYAPVGQIQ
jgi:hypothetical protein